MAEFDDSEDDFFTPIEEDQPTYSKETKEEIDFLGTDMEESPKEEDAIIALLEDKGFKEGIIKIQEEDGTEVEVPFNELNGQEQYDLLNSITDLGNELSEDELNFLNYIRQNKLSVNDYLKNYEEEFKNTSQIETEYNIDTYTDEELFVLDLREKYNLTDDEIIAQLDLEQQNPTVFQKKVAQMREEYRQLEEQYILSLEEQKQLDLEEERQAEISKVVNVAKMADSFHGIELDSEDKEETLSYLFDLDTNGVSGFAKDINDPKKLYEAAWYLKYGKEAFELIQQAYEKEIAALKKKDKPAVVVNSRKSNSIHDLY